MLSRDFLRSIHDPAVLYVNREEDMGLEGMRKAKRSYNPARMVEKYMLSLRDLTDEKGIWGKEND